MFDVPLWQPANTGAAFYGTRAKSLSSSARRPGKRTGNAGSVTTPDEAHAFAKEGRGALRRTRFDRAMEYVNSVAGREKRAVRRAMARDRSKREAGKPGTGRILGWVGE